ncbi:MAG: hypothetical protein GX661_05280 [Acholeplasmataceae bacterium]|nr:hypothetical protein [Acholeplasmataceae bacterium]
MLSKKNYERVYTLGLLLMVLNIIGRRYEFLNDFMQGLTLSAGCIMVIVSGILLHWPRLVKKMETEENDERCQTIKMQTHSQAFFINQIMISILIFTFGWFGEDYFIITIVLAALLAFNTLVTVILRAIYQRRY